MTETCCCPSEGVNAVCDLNDEPDDSAEPSSSGCPECGQKGKSVEVQTVKSMISITLREVKNDSYRFCCTGTCPVVYFGVENNRVFTIADVRERVYQKEPKTEDVLICYCFNHSVSEIRSASPDEGKSILMCTHDIFRAKDIADRVGIMKEGRLVMVRTREEFLEDDLEKIYLEYMQEAVV